MTPPTATGGFTGARASEAFVQGERHRWAGLLARMKAGWVEAEAPLRHFTKQCQQSDRGLDGPWQLSSPLPPRGDPSGTELQPLRGAGEEVPSLPANPLSFPRGRQNLPFTWASQAVPEQVRGF